MANEHPESTPGRGAQQITLDQLISTASQSVLRALEGRPTTTLPHPRIWVGLWIEPNHGGVLGEGPITAGRAEK